jgi:hypothetical protein
MTKQEVKDNIDQDIALKSTANSISPTNVGKNMKDIVDLIPDLSNQQLIDSMNLKISWKNGDTTKTKTPSEYSIGVQNAWVFTRNGFLYSNKQQAGLQYDGVRIKSIEKPIVNIDNIKNLLINVKDFSKIKDFSPKLVITKYKPSKSKGVGSENNDWRIAGFKDSKQNNPFKPSRITLLGIDNIIDFGQEYYFYKSSNNRLEAKGVGGRYSIDNRRTSRLDTPSAYIYIQLGLSITINGKEYISKYSTTLKMTLDGIRDKSGFFTTSTINFKFA